MPIDSRIVKNVVAKELSRIRTISDLARLLGSPPEALKKEFVRKEGTSISRYISEVRIERAKALLSHSNWQCKELCLAIGFSRADTGSHVFKRYTGMSMEEFRKTTKMQ